MDLTILVVSWNGERHLERCLDSLLRQDTRAVDILLVDNGSTDRSLDIIDTAKRTAESNGSRIECLLGSTNLGYTGGANLGFRHLLERSPPPDIVLLLNQDTAAEPNLVSALLGVFQEDDRIGAVGCKLFYPGDRSLQHAGGYLSHPRKVGRHFGHHQSSLSSDLDRQREVEFVTGAAMALRLACLREVGLFDEVFSPGYYEDVDLCLRLGDLGWKVVYCPAARLEHVESASFSDRLDRLTLSNRNRIILALRWMDDQGFLQEYAAAELQHIRDFRSSLELRSLATAYLEVLLQLADIAKASPSLSHLQSQDLPLIIETLSRLRFRCIDELYSSDPGGR